MKFLLKYSDLLNYINDKEFIDIFSAIISNVNKIYVLIDTKDFSSINNIKKRGNIAKDYEKKLRKLNFPFHRVILFNQEDILNIMERNHFDVLLTSSIVDINNVSGNEFIDCIDLNVNNNKKIKTLIDNILKVANEPILSEDAISTNKPSEDKRFLKYYNKKALRDLKRFSLDNSSIYEHICSQNQDFLSDIAIDYYGNIITYFGLEENVTKYQKAFLNIGVKKNDSVAICAPNVPDPIYAVFALQNIGAIPIPLHVYSKSTEMDYYFKKENVKYIVMIGMQETYENIDLSIKNNENIKKVVVIPLNTGLGLKSFESIKTRMGVKVLSSKLGKFLINIPKIIDDYKTNKNNNIIAFKDNLFLKFVKEYMNTPNTFKMPKNNKYITVNQFLRDGQDTQLINNYNDIATVIHTGGTTGIGKSTLLSHQNINRNDDAFEATIQNFERGDTIITIPPLFHILGLNNCIELILRNGGKIVLISKYRKNDLPSLFKKHHPELIFGVPKIGKDIITVDGFDNVDMSHLKYYVLGGEEMSKDFIDKSSDFLHKHGAKIDASQSLGGTEGSCSYTNTFDNCNIHGSIGIPLINVNAKIVNEDSNGNIIEAKYNEYGEICFHGDSIMLGYLNDDEANKKALRRHDDGKIWLHTGDCGYINENGILFFVDRIKDMFKINGEQVYPSEIKRVIGLHPLVKECAVVCIESEEISKRIVATVTLKRNSLNDQVVKLEILELCKQHLKRESIPQFIDIKEKLPETNLYKIDTKQISENYLQEAKKLVYKSTY